MVFISMKEKTRLGLLLLRELIKGILKRFHIRDFRQTFNLRWEYWYLQAEGVSTVTEGDWETRFQYIDELKKMGIKQK
jgi:hypothetical protein